MESITMSEQENITVVRKIFDGLNSHDLDIVDKYMASDVKTEAPGAPGLMDKQKDRMYTQQFINAFPDLRFDIRDIIAQGNWVAVTWTARGTHKAPLSTLQGDTIPPTNKSATVPGCTVVELKNEKVVRQHLYWDMVTLLTQLGVITSLAQMSRTR